MNTQNISRRKTSMVVYQLEKSLGELVLRNYTDKEQLNEQNVNEIIEREKEKGNLIDESGIDELVAATYLNELFQIAVDIFSDKSHYKDIESLYELCKHLKIFEVRNAISHPNRPFYDTYWYKIAALASDKTIHTLGLTDVYNALGSAENGTIKDPPEEWFDPRRYSLPSNLPSEYDHAITTLIGRKDESNALEKIYLTLG